MITNRVPSHVAHDTHWRDYTLDADGLAAILRYMPERLPDPVAEACRALLDTDRELVLAMATTDIPPARLRESALAGILAAETTLYRWIDRRWHSADGYALCDALDLDDARASYWSLSPARLDTYHVLPTCMLYGLVPEGRTQVPPWFRLAGIHRAWTERRIWEALQA